MKLSIIIPTLNEAENITRLLQQLKRNAGDKAYEILVVDGGSSDDTTSIVKEFGVAVYETSACRAIQMNHGAKMAKGEVLYFIHSDTLPPVSFYSDIEQALSEGYQMGCYRFKFDSKKYLLKINSYFTRFGNMWSRGGDQSLFVERIVFEMLGGYSEDFVIMEEYDLLRRAKNLDINFKVMAKDIIVSARKYDSNNYLRVQIANLVVYKMFRWGYHPKKILSTYRKLIDYRS